MVSLSVKHGAAVYELSSLDPDSTTVAHVHAMLEQRSGVFARHQKLILKGKVRRTPPCTLAMCTLPCAVPPYQ